MNKLEDLSDINVHTVKEIEHFFQVYKDLENKKVDVQGWGDVNEAVAMIEECTNRFEALEQVKKDSYSILL